jgi:hypothetical protein
MVQRQKEAIEEIQVAKEYVRQVEQQRIKDTLYDFEKEQQYKRELEAKKREEEKD